MTGQVRVERHGDGGRVAEIVLDRPEALNALSLRFAGELRDAVRSMSSSGRQLGPQVVVLSSALPRAFCVGADLKERNGFDDDQLRAQREVFRGLARAWLDLPVPAVAAVAGHALGGGFELALLCDLVVADHTAVLGLPEVSVGVVPGLGGTQLLSRRIGLARASDLIFTARRVSGAEAEAMGIVDRLVDAGSARAAALELAATIAGHSPVAVRNAKHALRTGLGLELDAAMDVEDAAWRAAAFSADRVEGVRAFVEKRTPDWPSFDQPS